MITLMVTCSETVSKLLITMLSSLTEEVSVEVVPARLPEGRQINPRVRYRVIAPESAPDALKALGEHTIMGMIFSDLIDRPLTAKDIRMKRPAFKDSTIQTDLVKLRYAGLIVAEPIVAEVR